MIVETEVPLEPNNRCGGNCHKLEHWAGLQFDNIAAAPLLVKHPSFPPFSITIRLFADQFTGKVRLKDKQTDWIPLFISDPNPMKCTPLQTTGLIALSLAFFVSGCGETEAPAPQTPTTPQAGFSQPMAPPQAPSMESLPPEVQAIVQKGQETQLKIQELTQKLGTIQEQAMEIEKVKQLRDALEKAAEEAMIKDSPDIKSTLERLPQLVELLEGNEEINSGNPATFSDETKKLIEEYETLSAKLQPIQAKAAALPEIEAAREELFKVLHEESVKLDPTFEEMEKEYEALNLQLQEAQQAFISAQQAAQQAVQQASEALPNTAVPMSPATNPAAAAEAATEAASEAVGSALKNALPKAVGEE